MSSPDRQIRDSAFIQLGNIFERVDTFEKIPNCELIHSNQLPKYFSAEIHTKVWSDGVKIRASGELIQLAKQVKCSITLIHGDYDPHPVIGIQYPLSENNISYSTIILQKCGHTPWIERYAADLFFLQLKDEIEK